MQNVQTRTYWLHLVEKLARPVLTALASGQLRTAMPIECVAGRETDRAQYTHLEAFARLLCGIAPWLESTGGSQTEQKLRQEFVTLAQQSLRNAVNPASPDFLNFSQGQQPIVDTAFLAQAILRAPQTLWEFADTQTQQNLVAALQATRTRKPYWNNWLLFAATIEAALLRLEQDADLMRIDYALRQHEQWYKGDGAYGDGPDFHWDYYNSFVIQPMLLEVLGVVASQDETWQNQQSPVLARAQRYAQVLERLIGTDGSFPPLGRSLAYRGGAFHLLALLALREQLPASIHPAQVRGALTAVLEKTLSAPGTFNTNGWLQIGLRGHQPGLGEAYISTGSLYLCSAALLPLGLNENSPFWSDAPEPWTAQKIWSGQDMPADHALYGV